MAYEMIQNEETGATVAIRCLECGRTSYHPGDIQEKYCGNCHKFHEDGA